MWSDSLGKHNQPQSLKADCQSVLKTHRQGEFVEGNFSLTYWTTERFCCPICSHDGPRVLQCTLLSNSVTHSCPSVARAHSNCTESYHGMVPRYWGPWVHQNLDITQWHRKPWGNIRISPNPSKSSWVGKGGKATQSYTAVEDKTV